MVLWNKGFAYKSLYSIAVTQKVSFTTEVIWALKTELKRIRQIWFSVYVSVLFYVVCIDTWTLLTVQFHKGDNRGKHSWKFDFTTVKKKTSDFSVKCETSLAKSIRSLIYHRPSMAKFNQNRPTKMSPKLGPLMKENFEGHQACKSENGPIK